jgi:signal transduction histidine kinase
MPPARDRSAAEPRLPAARLARIGAVGGACALLVLAAGLVAERVVFGGDQRTARARAEADIRSTFDDMTGVLQGIAGRLNDPTLVSAAVQDDLAAARSLFDAARLAVATAPAQAERAVTVYGVDGRPLAWSGRPSEIPPSRLVGPAAWFFARGALGLRLVFVQPVNDTSGMRVGSIAAEHGLTSAPTAVPEADVFVFPGRIAPAAIQLSFEAAQTRPDAPSFDVVAPTGERVLSARINDAELDAARAWWRRASVSLALMVFAVAVALCVGPLLDWRNRIVRGDRYAVAVAMIAAAVVGARVLLRLASPADWSASPLFSGVDYASALAPPFLASPFDFLMTAVAVGALAALLLFAVEDWRIRGWHRRRAVADAASRAWFALVQLSAGLVAALVLRAHYALLRDTLSSTNLDLLHFSLHPWLGTRLALQVGLVIWHAAVFGCVAFILLAAIARFRIPRSGWRFAVLTAGLWLLPLVLLQILPGTTPQLPLVLALGAVIALVLTARRHAARYRHGSQAFRLIMTAFGLVVPAVVFYPSVFELGWRAKAQLVETNYAPQALNQRRTIQRLLEESLDVIDRFPGLAQLVALPPLPGDPPASPDRAFQVWRLTGLAEYPVTSSVELHGPDGQLVSRFAFNLPEDPAIVARSDEQSCDWEIYEEVSPFFGEDRRVLHAGRLLCDEQRAPAGSIVVHAMMSDYANLPFIGSQNPYVELMRPSEAQRGEGVAGRDIEFAFYGWSRTPLYSSDIRAWTLSDEVFARVERSRDPVWARLERGEDEYDVHLSNDRGGIYALGFPVLSPLDHLVSLAELTVLAWGTYAVLLAIGATAGAFSRRGTTARALLREVRASFFRKLLLAFILATVVPVVALALATRAYIADELTANVEQEAVRTASAARRVVEDLVAPRIPQDGVVVDDNLMVWVSRLIDQDVNIFAGPQLVATSERNLFASGVLPTRTSADVYRALQLEREAAAVTREQFGTLGFLVAATAITAPQSDTMLTVPLTSRQQEIEAEIDTLDRRVLLGALLFVFGGAGIGYWLAERIADPVKRLTRATRRIARGDLDARIAATSSDELRRLVEDFNRMARELQRQQKELERTHRLEAWAEMARQVAHEIKNPLTPIQLNAEHLRRVHADRGEPLSPVLEECVGTILTQVKLLRQIASEFSSFASAPAVRLGEVDVSALLHETIDPYRVGLGDRIDFDVDVPATLPPVFIDRTLIARALTNIVENALHAMPGHGTLHVDAAAVDSVVRIRVADSGVGMDADALGRAFEPYFSTKATGTGLGLPIAKRNIESSGGTIRVASERDRGTTVELTLPVAAL